MQSTVPKPIQLADQNEQFAFLDTFEGLSEEEIHELISELGKEGCPGTNRQKYTIEYAALISLKNRAARQSGTSMIVVDEALLRMKYDLL